MIVSHLVFDIRAQSDNYLRRTICHGSYPLFQQTSKPEHALTIFMTLKNQLIGFFHLLNVGLDCISFETFEEDSRLLFLALQLPSVQTHVCIAGGALPNAK